MRKEWWKVIKHFNNAESRVVASARVCGGFDQTQLHSSACFLGGDWEENHRLGQAGSPASDFKAATGRIVTGWWFCFLLNALKAGPRRLFAIQACHHIQTRSKCVHVCEHVGYAKI